MAAEPIETLMAEHRLIEKTLDALSGYVDELRRGETADRADLARFVGFIREFADACHHGKEEDILFAEMVSAGFPRETGPIAVMLFEHDEGRRLVGRLAEAAERPESWTAEDRRAIAEAAKTYAALLRAHIHKEDRILYPMAEAHLTEPAMRALGERFERFERDATGAGAHERLHALADELAARYAPAAFARGLSDPGACAHGCMACGG